jgi:hypothetical protein
MIERQFKADLLVLCLKSGDKTPRLRTKHSSKAQVDSTPSTTFNESVNVKQSAKACYAPVCGDKRHYTTDKYKYRDFRLSRAAEM